VHVVQTRIRKLYTGQLVIARYALDCPLQAVRYWASSDLEADTVTLLQHITARWDIEVCSAIPKTCWASTSIN
jgi:hypothetical protein